MVVASTGIPSFKNQNDQDDNDSVLCPLDEGRSRRVVHVVVPPHPLYLCCPGQNIFFWGFFLLLEACVTGTGAERSRL